MIDANDDSNTLINRLIDKGSLKNMHKEVNN